MLKNYIILAVKVLRRRSFFTFISLFAVSFTLTILMFSATLLDHTFGPQPPETKLDRTLGVYTVVITGPERNIHTSPGYKFLDDHVRKLPNLEAVSLVSNQTTASIYLNGDRINLWLKRTDGNFWKILDFKFLEGEPYSAADDQNARPVAVINKSTAQKLFGDDSAINKSVTVDGQTFQVVGVVQDVSSLRYTPYADIWVPIGANINDSYKSEFIGGFVALLLAHDHSDFSAIRAEFADMLTHVELPDPKMYDHLSVYPESFFESTARDLFGLSSSSSNAQLFIAMIVGLMILFMMLPTINLININVSRILERASEIGVRKAFGASSLTLVNQFIVENLLLTMVGGLIALVMTSVGLQFLAGSGLIPSAEFHLNYRIFFYGLALTIVFGLLSGVYPAWRMSRLQPVEALRGRIS